MCSRRAADAATVDGQMVRRNIAQLLQPPPDEPGSVDVVLGAGEGIGMFHLTWLTCDVRARLQPGQRAASATSARRRCRSLKRSTLPLGVFGSSATK
jgi:hypothetical protein